MYKCIILSSMKPLSGNLGFSVCALIYASIRCIKSLISLASKNSVIRLLNDISTLMQLSPVVPSSRSWAFYASSGSNSMSGIIRFFHLTHRIMIIFAGSISFSWFLINVLMCGLLWSKELSISVLGAPGITKLLYASFNPIVHRGGGIYPPCRIFFIIFFPLKLRAWNFLTLSFYLLDTMWRNFI